MKRRPHATINALWRGPGIQTNGLSAFVAFTIFFASFVLSFAPTYSFSQSEYSALDSNTVLREGTFEPNEPAHGVVHDDNIDFRLKAGFTQGHSGTSSLPVAAPLFAPAMVWNGWSLQAQGSLFMRYTRQGGLRGNQLVDGPSWILGSVSREIGEHYHMGARVIVSLDPWAEGHYGYPLLFQEPQSWNGSTMTDRQHANDFFSEVAISNGYRFSEHDEAFIYLGMPGEPSLGPSSYMHRPSALAEPDAPLGTELQDGAHISHGVVTAGFMIHNFRIEASRFTGRRPDANRWNFDTPLFDSYSGRVSYNPTQTLSLQVSSGNVRNPLDDGIDIARTTASLIFATVLENAPETSRWMSLSAIWGENRVIDYETYESYLLEGIYSFGFNSLFGRFEYVDKDYGILGIASPRGVYSTVVPVSAASIGALRAVSQEGGLNISLGLKGSISFPHEALEKYYGKDPFSVEFYILAKPLMNQ